MSSRTLTCVVTGAAAMLAGACTDIVNPDPAAVAGTYTAADFWLGRPDSASVVLVNEGLSGAYVRVTLTPAGAMTGRLFVPRAQPDGSDLNADLTGSWRLADNGVQLEPRAGTFLRDILFAAEGERLHGYHPTDSLVVDLTLTRVAGR